MLLLKLFFAFFKVGLFAIGGAYSFIPLLEAELVEKSQWLTREEFLEVLGLIKVFPGAISIKYATYTGYKIGGISGAVVANIGNFLAPVMLVLIFGTLYWKNRDLASVRNAFSAIQYAVFAMILAVAFKLMPVPQMLNVRGALIIIAAFCLLFFTKVHPAFVIIGAGVLGIFLGMEA